MYIVTETMDGEFKTIPYLRAFAVLTSQDCQGGLGEKRKQIGLLAFKKTDKTASVQENR